MGIRIYEFTDAKLAYSASGTRTLVDIAYANGANATPNERTIEFEGDATVTRVYLAAGIDLEFTSDAWDFTALHSIFGDTAVTSSLPTGEAKRHYFGTTTQMSAKAGFEGSAIFINDGTSATYTGKFVIPVGTLSQVSPPVLATGAKASMRLRLSAERVAVDIAGVALPGVPTGGATYYMSEMNSL